MMDINQTSLTVAVAAIVIGIIIAVFSNRHTHRIARKSGAFRKVVFDVSLRNHSFIHDPQFSKVIFGCSVNKGDGIICVLPFTISNDGELSAKNVAIRLVFPLVFKFGGFAIFELGDILGSYDKSDIKRNSFKDESFEYVDYIIPEIQPKASIIIEEKIGITYSCNIPFKVDVTSIDGVPLQVEGSLAVSPISIQSTQINVQVSATDVEPVQGHFKVRTYQSQDKEELGKKIIEEETEALREDLSRIGAPKKAVSGVYAPGVSEKTMVIIPKLRKIPKPKEYSDVKETVYIEEYKKSEMWIVAPKWKKFTQK